MVSGRVKIARALWTLTGPSLPDRRRLRLPGVYRPQADTRLLLRALRDAGLGRGWRALDLYTGCGVGAVEAVRCGAGEVTAVDVYLPAVASAWINTLGLPARIRRREPADESFDVVLANPPYVPCPGAGRPSGPALAWDAGPDGRSHLDRLCDRAAGLLAPGGTMLVVHSAVCGVRRTLESLRGNGLSSSVAARAVEPFGPVMRGRAGYLEAAGLIEAGQRHEELVVIRADRRDGFEE